MRIAYVALHLEKKFIEGGVGRKIQTQIKFWQDYQHDVHFFLLSPDVDNLSESTVYNFSVSSNNQFVLFFKREYSRLLNLGKLINAVRAYEPDIIYLRYGLFVPPLKKLFSIAPVVVEINSNDILEYKHRGQVFYSYNLFTRRITLKNAAGFIPISQEIADLESNLVFNKPVLPIPNGIDIEGLEALPAPGNNPPRIAFVSNMEALWNGVDKLVAFAQYNPDILIDIIGMTSDQLALQTIPGNITCHGLVSIQRVKELLSRVDVSISALALHRKPCFENSLLKVRESLGYGIPTILACYDSDVSNKGFDFIYEIPNTRENVDENWQGMRKFIFDMIDRRADREALYPLINQRQKEEKRLAFMQSILQTI